MSPLMPGEDKLVMDKREKAEDLLWLSLIRQIWLLDSCTFQHDFREEKEKPAMGKQQVRDCLEKIHSDP